MSDEKPAAHSMYFEFLGYPTVPVQGEAHLQLLLEEHHAKTRELDLELLRAAYRCGVVQAEYARSEWAKDLERKNAPPDPPAPSNTRPTERSFELVRSGPVLRPTLTVEDCEKWHTFYVANPDGSMSTLPYSNLEGPTTEKLEGPPMVDHIPNPAYVVDYAKRHDLVVDPVALGMMKERWRRR